MTPFKLLPSFKDYLWGGTRLRDEFRKDSALTPLAESWELSCHPDGESRVADGPFAGLAFSEYLEKSGPASLGKNCEKFTKFPIMIKLIDAKEPLSIQVHPTEEYARRTGTDSKTEMWVVLDAEPGAKLIYGFKQPLTQEEFSTRICENTLLEAANEEPVRPGDVFFIEAGTLHAIGGGILLAEIQQNSNITYRVYDYGRLGPDGRPRALHTEEAIAVTVLAPPTRPAGPQGDPEDRGGWRETLLAGCPYFTVRRIETQSAYPDSPAGDSFRAILAVTDGLAICSEGQRLPLQKGETAFVPANAAAYTVEGKGTFLLTTV